MENIVTTSGISRRSLITNGGAVMLGATALAASTVILTGCAPGRSAEDDSSDGLAPGTILLPIAELPVGGTASVSVDGTTLLLAQPSEGTVVAFSAICTHQGCTVAARDADFRCPCHGSRYDAATGDVLAGPAKRALTAIAVAVHDGDVVVT